jgi:hypothetical protein
LAHTGLSQIAPLAAFSSLKILDLSDNNIVTVEPLKALTALEELNLAQNRVNGLDALQALFKLRRLDVSRNNPLRTLTNLAQLEALQVLSANNCGVQGNWTEVLPPLKALTHLHLKGNEKIIWLPYMSSKRSGLSSRDEGANNSAFNASFPGLQVLETDDAARLERTVDGILLSRLDRR